jgi:hypothetical protein
MYGYHPKDGYAANELYRNGALPDYNAYRHSEPRPVFNSSFPAPMQKRFPRRVFNTKNKPKNAVAGENGDMPNETHLGDVSGPPHGSDAESDAHLKHQMHGHQSHPSYRSNYNRRPYNPNEFYAPANYWPNPNGPHNARPSHNGPPSHSGPNYNGPARYARRERPQRSHHGESNMAADPINASD